MKNEMLTLILAGGQEHVSITQSIAKPALQFGGTTVSLTLTLSNCAICVHNVGVITQYQPLALITISEMVRHRDWMVSIYFTTLFSQLETFLKGLSRTIYQKTVTTSTRSVNP